MPKSNRSITPKSSSKHHRHPAPAARASTKAKTASAPLKTSPKNGHKNGHKTSSKTQAQPSLAAPSRSLTSSEKDNKGVQAVWTGQPERQERLRDLVKLAKDQGYLTW